MTTADQLRNRLDAGETITLTHPEHGTRTYARHPEPDRGYTVTWPEGIGDGTRTMGPTETAGFLGADLLDGWVERDYGTLTDYVTGEAIRPATGAEHARSTAAGETGAFRIDRDGQPCRTGADPAIFGPFRTVFVAGGPES